MATRLKAPSSGSKLARPIPTGPGGKSPMVRTAVRPSPGPVSGEGPVRAVPPGQRRPPAQGKPPQMVAKPPVQSSDLQVGDSVLVGGVKPGVVAFIGPTQFAPGVWAGVILDTYEGKNDGSVKGVSYFQCEPSRGLFARPDKLTLVQKPHSHSNSQPRAPPPQSQRPPQFEVGDHILVDGIKPGIVGFIGETQFARGLWAGIILDTPEGKNNGTVAGVQYFDCAPNHGLFTRPQKLTLVEKANSITPTPAAPSPQVRNASSHSSRPSQPTPSDLKALQEKLKLGDHVLVGGTKEGRLRYLGPTEFAKGIWAGVELPEPMGKNDGAVSGKRYFQCEPKHGIFAPLPKIEKLATAADSMSTMSAASLRSVSPTPPPLAMMPSPPGLTTPPSGIKMARGIAKPPSESSTSSFGLQEPRVSSLQGSTAASLSRLLQQREETISKLSGQLQEERNTHQEELTNLRRQVEDLQFQLLELGVISGDQLERSTETSQQRLDTLIQQLSEEKEKVRGLQAQLQGVGSKGGSSAEETQLFHSQLLTTQTELEDKRREMATQQDTISRLETERSDAQKLSDEIQKTLNNREEEIASTKQELGTLKSQISDLQQSLRVSEDQCQLLTQQKSSLEEQMEKLSELSGDSSQQLGFLQDQLREKESKFEEVYALNSSLSAQLETVQSEYQSYQLEQESAISRLQDQLAQERKKTTSLEREITQTSVAATDIGDELQRTQADLKDAMELCSQHEALVEERNHELATLEAQIRQLTQAQEQLASERTRLLSEQDRLAGERDRAIAECDQLMAASASSSSEQTELSRQRVELLAERDQLLLQQRALQTENEKLVGERDEVMHQLAKIQSDRQEAISNSQELNSKFESTNRELTDALGVIEGLREELVRAKENWEHEKLSFREQIELAGASGNEMREKINAACSERDSALQQAQVLAERLDGAETSRDQLQLSLEAGQGEIDELNYQMEELTLKYDMLEAEAADLQQRLESAESALGEREVELVQTRQEVRTLTEDLRASQGKTDQAIFEEEKLLLEERVRELTIQLERAKEKKSPARRGIVESEGLSIRLEETQSKLLEQKQENQDLQQQIEFLNSVIADLQRKLETAEALSGLHGPLEPADEYIEEDDEDLVQGLPPPRLFCDICDVFDQHDTDDCPLQAGSDSPPPTLHHGARAPGGSDRPYCDNCEMFGHTTEDCEYDATY